MKKTIISSLLIIIALFIYAKIDKSPHEDAISQELNLWISNAKTFQFKNYNISYHDTNESSKEVIFLLHGYPSSSFDWNLVWGEFSKDYRLIAIDMLGFGLSDKPNDIEYSISLQADLQEAILKSVDVKVITFWLTIMVIM